MEDKRVTHTARAVLRLWNVGAFAFVWFLFYNKFTFQTYTVPGGLVSILMFFIMYTALCNVYKAFRIASTDIGEIVFCQFIAFAASDLILYVECCLIFNHYVNVLPGLSAVGVQLVGTSIIVVYSKRYFMAHIEPQDTIVLFGKKSSLEEAQGFEKRLLSKYRHLFRIVYTESELISDEEFLQKLRECMTVIMYNVGTSKRAKIFEYCLEERKNFYYTPKVTDILSLGCEAKHLLDTPLMKYEYTYENTRKKITKRVLDIVFALLFIAVFSPFMLVIAICIKAEDHGPVFFRQKRYTINGKVFDILKFRSMIVGSDKGEVMPTTEGDPRITKTGKVIRKLRLDEVPQFFNILKGDMSFVGPRPERVEHVDMYTQDIPEFRYRLCVKGGLTGYAQVFGKYNTSAYDKLLLDLMYIENQSTLLDIKLFLLTARALFQSESTEGFDEKDSRRIRKKAAENRRGKQRFE